MTAFVSISDLHDRDLSADASDLRRFSLAGARSLSASDPNQPHLALCRIFLRRRRCRCGRLESGRACGEWGAAKRWTVWLAFAICLLWRDPASGLCPPQLVVDFNSPPLWWHIAYGLAFAMFSAAMTFTVPAIFLRFARSRLWLLDAMRPSAYGIYLLHYIFLIWLQYFVYDPAFPGVRQIRDRVRRHAFDELGADRAVAKNSRRSADDLAVQACRPQRDRARELRQSWRIACPSSPSHLPASPRCSFRAVSTAAISSGAAKGLARKQMAPAFSARARTLSSGKAVIKMNGALCPWRAYGSEGPGRSWPASAHPQ